MISIAIPTLYFVIAFLFILNFFHLYRKFKNGSIKINHLNVIAIISLIVTFLSLGFYFINFNEYVILGSQIYLILNMLYVRNKSASG